MWVYMQDEEWYPVPTAKRLIGRRDIGADVPRELVFAQRKAARAFWKATKALEKAYYSSNEGRS